MNNNIEIRNSNVKRSYLKTTGIMRLYGIMIAILLLAVAAIWLFTLRYTVDLKGFCSPFQQNVTFYYSVDIADNVHVGDDIRVGNAKGKVTFLNKKYITADTLKDSLDTVDVDFMNSEYFDDEETYLCGFAQFDSVNTNNHEYSLVQREMTIGEWIYEWAKATLGIG